jgi:phospholipid/cholesterol/gamma-HCH transport system ATP-binding protein
VIRINQLCKTIQGQKILKGLDLTIQTGENLVIVGRSGGGKSVLLKHILGIMQPDTGEVWYDQINLTTLSERQLTPMRREMGMVFQNGALFDSMTVGDNVAFSLREHREESEDWVSSEVARALELVGLNGQQHKLPAELSGGMRKRVALARAIISHPKLMLYDEPTAGLDPIASDSIDKLMLRMSEKFSITSVIITHDMKSACEVGDRIAMLHEGKIYTILTPDELRASQDPVIYKFVHGISEGTQAIF